MSIFDERMSISDGKISILEYHDQRRPLLQEFDDYYEDRVHKSAGPVVFLSKVNCYLSGHKNTKTITNTNTKTNRKKNQRTNTTKLGREMRNLKEIHNLYLEHGDAAGDLDGRRGRVGVQDLLQPLHLHRLLGLVRVPHNSYHQHPHHKKVYFKVWPGSHCWFESLQDGQ